jgi:hypothetical protein
MRNEKNPVQAEFLILLDGYCAGTLDETASGRFVGLLESDQSYKRTFVEYVDLHADLYDQVGLVDHEFDIPHLLHVINDANDDLERKSRYRAAAAAFISCLLCTLVFVAAGWYWFEYTYRFGKVLAVTGGSLAFREELREVDQRLGFGRLAIDEGAASIQLNDKVSFLMEAGSQVDVLSRHSIRLLKGHISVETGGGKVEVLLGKQRLNNLGTSFAVSHDDTQPSELHVVDGAIVLKSSGEQPKSELSSRFDAGEAASVADNVPPAALPFNRSAFISAKEFTDSVQQGQVTAAIHQLREHQRNRAKGLVLRHSFEEVRDGDEYVLNQAQGNLGFGRGKIYGAIPVAGRAPGAVALRFRGKEEQDRVELNVEDSLRFDPTGPMTLIVWFRTEGLDHKNARLISRGIQKSLAWNVWWRKADDVFGVGYRTEGDEPHVVGHLAFQDGNWHQVAVTWKPLDLGRSEITLYFDGEFVKQHDNVTVQSTDAPLLIGNCISPDGQFLSFLGDIDDVSLFKRPLTAAEIAADFLQQ